MPGSSSTTMTHGAACIPSAGGQIERWFRRRLSEQTAGQTGSDVLEHKS